MSVKEIRARICAGELFTAWRKIRRIEPTDDAAMARLAYELAAAGVHRGFSLQLAVDIFCVSPGQVEAINLSNVIGLLGEEECATEIYELVPDMQGAEALLDMKMSGPVGPSEVSAMLAASKGPLSVNRDAVLAVVKRARASLGL